MIDAGFEPCPRRRERSDNVGVDVRERSDNVRRLRFADDEGGSTDWRCALREPTTQVDPRSTYLEQSIGEARIALLRELGGYDSILQAMPQFRYACCLVARRTPAVMSMEDCGDADILLTLDSGCRDHIVDMAYAPGYACVLHPSAGSQRGRNS